VSGLEAHWFEMDHPADWSGLQALVGDTSTVDRLAIVAKTEGHTAPNDFARQLARQALDPWLAPLAADGRAVVVLANGCEGVATPGGYALVRRRGEAATGLRLGLARSLALPREVVGTPAMVDVVAACVADACDDAGLAPADAGLVIVKGPTLLSSDTVGEPWRADQHRGRALAALGIAVALGEVARDAVDDRTIGHERGLWSRRAMTFAGPEAPWVEALVLGGAPARGGLKLGVCHPTDLLDAPAVRRLARTLGLAFDDDGALREPQRLVGVFSKAGLAADGRVRGARTGVFSSAYSPDSAMRAAQSGLLGGLFGSTRFFVSGDPVHQAPPGGAVVALLVKDRA
jgi:cyanuric acid amidohydrolase